MHIRFTASILHDMREVTLTEYLDDGGKRQDVARFLEVTPPAITKMLNTGRDVRLILDDRGKLVRCYEKKPLGRQ